MSVVVVTVGVVVDTVGVSGDCYCGCGSFYGGCLVGAQGQDVTMGVVVVTTVVLLLSREHKLLYENSLHMGMVNVTMGFEWCSGCGSPDVILCG